MATAGCLKSRPLVGASSHARAGRPSAPPSRPRLTTTTTATASAAARPLQPPLPTLYDVPVSNYCARVRYVLYSKGLVDGGLVALDKPSALGGGLQSPEYKALNPHAKMPLFHLASGTRLPVGSGSPQGDALYEADGIVRYILAKWPAVGPSFAPPTPEAGALSDLCIKVMDTYLFPHQGCMYKGGMEPGARAAGLAAIAGELEVLEGLLSGGPRVVGEAWTPADASLFPTLVFCEQILPKHFGWEGFWDKRPRLAAHYKHMSQADPAGKKVVEEIVGGLAAWEGAEGGGRWEALGIAGQVRDDPGAFRH